MDSALHSQVLRLASSWPVGTPARRELLTILAEDREARLKNFDGKEYDLHEPKSVYDHIARPMQPFTWATPAKNIDGTYPLPWRVGHAAEAKKYIQSLDHDFKSVWVEHSSPFRGREALSVGFADNRNKQVDMDRMAALAAILHQHKMPYKLDGQGTHMTLMDDLVRDILQKTHKSAATPVDPELRRLIEAFRKQVGDTVAEHFATNFPTLTAPEIVLEWGKRYVRVIKQRGPTDRSAFGFIDLTKGDLLKAESWK